MIQVGERARQWGQADVSDGFAVEGILWCAVLKILGFYRSPLLHMFGRTVGVLEYLVFAVFCRLQL